MKIKNIGSPFSTEAEKRDDLLKIINTGKDEAIREQMQTISPAIKALTPFVYIDRIGKMKVKEICKVFDDKVNIYYRINRTERYKHMILAYIVILLKNNKIRVPYDVTFSFEKEEDRKWFERELWKVVENLPEHCTLDTIYTSNLTT